MTRRQDDPLNGTATELHAPQPPTFTPDSSDGAGASSGAFAKGSSGLQSVNQSMVVSIRTESPRSVVQTGRPLRPPPLRDGLNSQHGVTVATTTAADFDCRTSGDGNGPTMMTLSLAVDGNGPLQVTTKQPGNAHSKRRRSSSGRAMTSPSHPGTATQRTVTKRTSAGQSPTVPSADTGVLLSGFENAEGVPLGRPDDITTGSGAGVADDDDNWEDHRRHKHRRSDGRTREMPGVVRDGQYQAKRPLRRHFYADAAANDLVHEGHLPPLVQGGRGDDETVSKLISSGLARPARGVLDRFSKQLNKSGKTPAINTERGRGANPTAARMQAVLAAALNGGRRASVALGRGASVSPTRATHTRTLAPLPTGLGAASISYGTAITEPHSAVPVSLNAAMGQLLACVSNERHQREALNVQRATELEQARRGHVCLLAFVAAAEKKRRAADARVSRFVTLIADEAAARAATERERLETLCSAAIDHLHAPTVKTSVIDVERKYRTALSAMARAGAAYVTRSREMKVTARRAALCHFAQAEAAMRAYVVIEWRRGLLQLSAWEAAGIGQLELLAAAGASRPPAEIVTSSIVDACIARAVDVAELRRADAANRAASAGVTTASATVTPRAAKPVTGGTAGNNDGLPSNSYFPYVCSCSGGAADAPAAASEGVSVADGAVVATRARLSAAAALQQVQAAICDVMATLFHKQRLDRRTLMDARAVFGRLCMLQAEALRAIADHSRRATLLHRQSVESLRCGLMKPLVEVTAEGGQGRQAAQVTTQQANCTTESETSQADDGIYRFDPTVTTAPFLHAARPFVKSVEAAAIELRQREAVVRAEIGAARDLLRTVPASLATELGALRQRAVTEVQSIGRLLPSYRLAGHHAPPPRAAALAPESGILFTNDKGVGSGDCVFASMAFASLLPAAATVPAVIETPSAGPAALQTSFSETPRGTSGAETRRRSDMEVPPAHAFAASDSQRPSLSVSLRGSVDLTAAGAFFASRRAALERASAAKGDPSGEARSGGDATSGPAAQGAVSPGGVGGSSPTPRAAQRGAATASASVGPSGAGVNPAAVRAARAELDRRMNHVPGALNAWAVSVAAAVNPVLVAAATASSAASADAPAGVSGASAATEDRISLPSWRIVVDLVTPVEPPCPADAARVFLTMELASSDAFDPMAGNTTSVFTTAAPQPAVVADLVPTSAAPRAGKTSNTKGRQKVKVGGPASPDLPEASPPRADVPSSPVSSAVTPKKIADVNALDVGVGQLECALRRAIWSDITNHPAIVAGDGAPSSDVAPALRLQCRCYIEGVGVVTQLGGTQVPAIAFGVLLQPIV